MPNQTEARRPEHNTTVNEGFAECFWSAALGESASTFAGICGRLPLQVSGRSECTKLPIIDRELRVTGCDDCDAHLDVTSVNHSFLPYEIQIRSFSRR
jgi:hypothetical protein